jgi:hypothetical protein
MTSTALVPTGTITFYPGGGRVRYGYTPPRNTCDLRSILCTDHHPACDCREAMWAENQSEWKWERDERQRTVWAVLQGHQFDYPSTIRTEYDRMRFGARCFCSGCVILRSGWTYDFLPIGAIDHRTGRIKPCPVPPRRYVPEEPDNPGMPAPTPEAEANFDPDEVPF